MLPFQLNLLTYAALLQQAQQQTSRILQNYTNDARPDAPSAPPQSSRREEQQQSRSEEESQSSRRQEESRPPRRQPHRRCGFNLEAPKFPAQVDRSQQGKHPILRYAIPGSPLCYTFHHLRTNSTYEVYRCTGCKCMGTNTMIAVGVTVKMKMYININVKAINNEFLGDPSALSHDCLPAKIAQDKVERLVYKDCENIRKDKRRVETTTRKAWQEIENHIEENEGENETQKLDMLHYFHRDGYESRRSTIKRAIKSLDDKSCTMDHVPRIYSHFSDGERFLQFQTPDLHMYYSTTTIEKAQRFGLYALVADGVHDLQPDATAKCGQLYTVHGVCNDTMDAPLLYAITTTKNERTYELIFAQLKEELQRSGRLDRLRVVLDFERASIGAARKVFPFASVEGCGFHLAVAWNRKKDALGIRKYLRRRFVNRDKSVWMWWNVIKGIMFLPPALHKRVPSLYRPDLPRNHEAYQKCEEFLRYLKSTWYEGPFKGMWNKWGIKDTRTTNAAEAFHRKLGTLLECKYPLMSRLLEELKSCNTNAKGDFLNMERRPTDGRRLRRRDLRRREKILKMMAAYRSRFERRNTIRTSTNQIMKYCRKMATFVTSKTN
ncbi:unnamed protein product [Cylicocyclus nassatus]|uniref:MULE transposase domain-containing protein n=1 Tax=Cylicocyclus nassatus TaxID=53992 RepID=A0AA36H917_CYLNA|nr:unnamed protein product [Cylicocyclus nassatus]